MIWKVLTDLTSASLADGVPLKHAIGEKYYHAQVLFGDLKETDQVHEIQLAVEDGVEHVAFFPPRLAREIHRNPSASPFPYLLIPGALWPLRGYF